MSDDTNQHNTMPAQIGHSNVVEGAPIPAQLQAISAQYPPDGLMRLYLRFAQDHHSSHDSHPWGGYHYAETQSVAAAVSHAVGRGGEWTLAWSSGGDTPPIALLRSEDVDADTQDWARGLHLRGRGW